MEVTKVDAKSIHWNTQGSKGGGRLQEIIKQLNPGEAALIPYGDRNPYTLGSSIRLAANKLGLSVNVTKTADGVAVRLAE